MFWEKFSCGNKKGGHNQSKVQGSEREELFVLMIARML